MSWHAVGPAAASPVLGGGALWTVNGDQGLPFAADRVAVLREARRILVPGGRLAVTVRVIAGGGRGDWPAMARSIGMRVEDSLISRSNNGFWRRLYASWLAREPQLRAELGDRAAENLIAEARQGMQRSEDLPPHELLVLQKV